jgi:hypothetical protein
MVHFKTEERKKSIHYAMACFPSNTNLAVSSLRVFLSLVLTAGFHFGQRIRLTPRLAGQFGFMDRHEHGVVEQ